MKIHNCRNNNTIFNTQDWIEYTDEVKEAVEKQTSFKNEVVEIREWFLNNKDCLLDSAMNVARDGFIESSINDCIDEVDLDFIIESAVDEIQEGILNMLDTFKDD